MDTTIKPGLLVACAGAKLVFSWPTEGTAGFVLEKTSSLTNPTWASAGGQIVVSGTLNTVTLDAGGSAFFRLKPT